MDLEGTAGQLKNLSSVLMKRLTLANQLTSDRWIVVVIGWWWIQVPSRQHTHTDALTLIQAHPHIP